MQRATNTPTRSVTLAEAPTRKYHNISTSTSNPATKMITSSGYPGPTSPKTINGTAKNQKPTDDGKSLCEN